MHARTKKIFEKYFCFRKSSNLIWYLWAQSNKSRALSSLNFTNIVYWICIYKIFINFRRKLGFYHRIKLSPKISLKPFGILWIVRRSTSKEYAQDSFIKLKKKSVTRFLTKLLVIGNGNFGWILKTTFGWLSQSESRKAV